jgi:hypothetical protein
MLTSQPIMMNRPVSYQVLDPGTLSYKYASPQMQQGVPFAMNSAMDMAYDKKLLYNVNGMHMNQMKGAPIVTNIKVKQGMEQPAHNQMTEMTFDSEKEIVSFMVRSQEFCQFLTDLIQYLKRITENDSDMDSSVTKDTNSDIELASNYNEENREIGLESDNERMQDLTMMAERLLNTLANQNNFNRVIQGIFQLVKKQSEQQKKERSQQQDPDKKQSFMKTKELSMLDLVVPPKELTKFLEMFWDLYLELDNNEIAKRFFEELRNYVSLSILKPEQSTTEHRKKQAQVFTERFVALYHIEKGDFKNLIKSLLASVTNVVSHLKNYREGNSQKGDLAMEKLCNLGVGKQSIHQFKRTIVPMIKHALEMIPISSIEDSNRKYYYKIENLMFEGKNIFSDGFELELVSDLNVSEDNIVLCRLELLISNHHLLMPALKFLFKRKTAPKIEDRGSATISIRGLKLNIIWNLYMSENGPINFELAHVKCLMDKVSIDITDSNHRLLNKLALRMYGSTIRRKIPQALVEKIRDTLLPLSNKMNSLFGNETDKQITPSENVKKMPANDEVKEKPENSNNNLVDSLPSNNLTNENKATVESNTLIEADAEAMNNMKPEKQIESVQNRIEVNNNIGNGALQDVMPEKKSNNVPQEQTIDQQMSDVEIKETFVNEKHQANVEPGMENHAGELEQNSKEESLKE